jgi:hypothetical protein
MKIQINNMTFPTKKMATTYFVDHFKNIWWENKNKRKFGRLLPIPLTNQDKEILLNIYNNIPSNKTITPFDFQIITNKFNYFELQYCTEPLRVWNSFYIQDCVAGKLRSTSPNQTLNKVLRQAVEPQIMSFRQEVNCRVCSLCRGVNNVEVDHFPMLFSGIINQFKTQFDHTNDQILENKDVIQSFTNFHLEKAKYRFLCSVCNKKSYHEGIKD